MKICKERRLPQEMLSILRLPLVMLRELEDPMFMQVNSILKLKNTFHSLKEMFIRRRKSFKMLLSMISILQMLDHNMDKILSL